MAFVEVTRIPRPGLAARVADMGLLLTGLAVPFVILAIGAPLALALWGLLWIAARLFG
jgi:hypothetical protein